MEKQIIDGIAFWCYNAEKSGIPTLMIHGHGGDHRGLEVLAKNMDTTVYLPDLPGFGESDNIGEYSLRKISDRLGQLVGSLNLKEYNLVGHSLGSAIVLQLAAENKAVKSLTLINPLPEFHSTIEKILLKLHNATEKIPEPYAHRLVHAHIYNLATFLVHSRQRMDSNHRKNYLQQQADAKYSVQAWRESGMAIYKANQLMMAGRIEVPTLIMHGDLDGMTTLTSIGNFAGKFKQARVARCKNGGHLLPIEQTEWAASQINNFLDKI